MAKKRRQKRAKFYRNFRNKSRSIFMLRKIDKNKKCAPKLIFPNNFFFQKGSVNFCCWKLTLKIRFWHFLTSFFGHLTSLMKKSNPFSWSVQSYLQSEMFLSNSVDMMKNLQCALYAHNFLLKYFFFKFSLLKKIITFALRVCSICLVLSDIV